MILLIKVNKLYYQVTCYFSSQKTKKIKEKVTCHLAISLTLITVIDIFLSWGLLKLTAW